jgi:hypothetical protein
MSRKRSKCGNPKRMANACSRAYADRSRVVKYLGFKDYAAYLKSPLWAGIRSRVLAADPRCCSCGGKATEVHHADYNLRTMRGEMMSSLMPVCGRCHERAEYHKRGHKLPPEQATRFLTRNAKPAKPPKPAPVPQAPSPNNRAERIRNEFFDMTWEKAYKPAPWGDKRRGYIF